MKTLAALAMVFWVSQAGWAKPNSGSADSHLEQAVFVLVNPTIHETDKIMAAIGTIRQMLEGHHIRELPKEVRIPILKSVLTREKIHEGSEAIFHATGEIIETYLSQITSSDETLAKQLAVAYSDDLKVLAREEGELFSNPLVKMDSDDTVAHRYVSYLKNALVSTCPIDTAKAIISAIKAGIRLQKSRSGPISPRLLLDLDDAFRRAQNPEIQKLILDALAESAALLENSAMRQYSAELYDLLKPEPSCARDLGN